jgi:hypothetical protein
MYQTVQMTIIDSFRVTQELLQKQQGYLPDGYPALGTWYVLDGWLSSESRTPAIGSLVSVVTPSGERIECQLAAFEIRHGVAAVQFHKTNRGLPRHSFVTIDFAEP